MTMNPQNPDPLYGGYQRSGMPNQQQMQSMQNMMMMQNMNQINPMSSMPNMMSMNPMGVNSLNTSSMQMQQMQNIQNPLGNNMLNPSMMMNQTPQYNYPRTPQGRMMNQMGSQMNSQIPNNSMMQMGASLGNQIGINNSMSQFPNQSSIGFNQSIPPTFQPQPSQPLPSQSSTPQQKKRHSKSTNPKRHGVPQPPTSPTIYQSPNAQTPTTPQQVTNIHSPIVSSSQAQQQPNMISPQQMPNQVGTPQTHSPKTPTFGPIQSTPMMTPDQINSRLPTTPQIPLPISNPLQPMPEISNTSTNPNLSNPEVYNAQQHLLKHANQPVSPEFNMKIQIEHVNQLTDEKQDLFYSLFECNKLNKQKEERTEKFLSLFVKHIYPVSANSPQIISYLIDQFRQNSDKYQHLKEPPLPPLFYRKKRAKPLFKMLAILQSSKDTFSFAIPQKVRKDSNVLILGQFYCVTETIWVKSILIDKKETQPVFFGQSKPYFLVSNNSKNSNPISITINTTEQIYPLLTFFILQFVSRADDLDLLKNIANMTNSTKMIEGISQEQVQYVKICTNKCGPNCSFSFTQAMEQLAQTGSAICPTCGHPIILKDIIFNYIPNENIQQQPQPFAASNPPMPNAIPQQQMMTQNNTPPIATPLVSTKPQLPQVQNNKKKQTSQSVPPQQEKHLKKQNKRAQNSSSSSLNSQKEKEKQQIPSSEPSAQQRKNIANEPKHYIGRIASKKLFPPTPTKILEVPEENEETIRIRNQLQDNLTLLLKPTGKGKLSSTAFNSNGIGDFNEDDFDDKDIDSYIDFFNQFD